MMRCVRTLMLWLAFALCASILHAQPVATASQAFAFDYKTTDLTASAVVRFEMQVDGGSWSSVAIPPTANDAQTPAGFNTYAVPIPALVTGTHTVTFRACNAQLCSDPMPPLSFVLAVKPPAPAGLRIK